MANARIVGLIGAIGVAGALALPAAVSAGHEGRDVLVTRLTGAQEVPGPGDPDGRGVAVLRVDAEEGTICYLVTARRIDPATAAHIHVAPRGVAGPVVQGLEAPTDGRSSSCVQNAALAEALIEHPSEYYVNVHNATFPGGAVRGQLG